MSDIEFHPVQTHAAAREDREIPASVTLRAYEVYKHIHGEQRAMIENGCRGGFGVGELFAFLYARSFPKEEWAARADEAFRRPIRNR